MFWEKVYKTAAFYQAKALAGLRGLRFDLAVPQLGPPVFVVGCSRAGTTLVYKTLSEAAALGSLQKETHDFWAGLHPPAERGWDSHAIPPEAACAGDCRQVASLFYTRTGKRRFVDKNNQNGLSIPYLQRLFPDAFFVYVKRNPGDNIHSLMEGWRRAETFATWSRDLPAEVRIDGGRFRRWCFFLPPGWRNYLEAPLEEVCAFQYREMNAAILAARDQVAPERWCEIAYESILENPVEAFAEVFRRCQVPFDRHLEDHCRSVLQKPYNAFSRVGLDKWKGGANRDRIERVLPQVQEVAERMGYS
ncbi:sulfotransferase [Methylomarinovum caldicuralii]|uniref:sulfotransferase family protein n=1 Tax=Methylomarinovum caldicuralii TaxID=438856 RepID=UPI0029555E2E|nr:sulfotransferase [Methylomarinovum caldicuralii]